MGADRRRVPGGRVAVELIDDKRAARHLQSAGEHLDRAEALGVHVLDDGQELDDDGEAGKALGALAWLFVLVLAGVMVRVLGAG